MENIVIYEDDNTKIEVSGFLDYYLNNIHVPTIGLNEKHFQALSPFMNTRLSEYNNKIYKTSYWGRAPIFQFGKYIQFAQPFDIFMDAQAFICSCEHDITKNTKQTESAVELVYFKHEGHFIAHIFYEKIYGIQGYFAYVDEKEKNILIMFWGYEPPDNNLLESM